MEVINVISGFKANEKVGKLVIGLNGENGVDD